MKTYFYIESLGCAKNQVDSEVIISLLEAYGLVYTEDPAAAALIVVNTCGFIEPAKQESVDTALELKSKYPDKPVIITGCLVLRYADELKSALPDIDGVWSSLQEPSFKRFLHTRFNTRLTSIERRIMRNRVLSFPGSVYVKIADGCSNRCTYCAIPLIRGSLASRPRAEIVAEARRFIGRGICEINLVAQDSASFGTDRGMSDLVPLLYELAGLEGDFWIRLLYLHPDHLNEPIIEAVREHEKIIPYFDIPFQHASKRILSAMNRAGSDDSYTALVRHIRRVLPQAVIRTTFLVGFPGETDDDFNRLAAFQQAVRPQWAGVFTYSREEDTPAFSYKPAVPKKTARQRKSILESAQSLLTEQWLDSLIGRVVTVLIEEEVKGERLALARAWFQAPEVDGVIVLQGTRQKPGTRVKAKITSRRGMDLEAVTFNE